MNLKENNYKDSYNQQRMYRLCLGGCVDELQYLFNVNRGVERTCRLENDANLSAVLVECRDAVVARFVFAAMILILRRALLIKTITTRPPLHRRRMIFKI